MFSPDPVSCAIRGRSEAWLWRDAIFSLKFAISDRSILIAGLHAGGWLGFQVRGSSGLVYFLGLMGPGTNLPWEDAPGATPLHFLRKKSEDQANLRVTDSARSVPVLLRCIGLLGRKLLHLNKASTCRNRSPQLAPIPPKRISITVALC